MTWDVIQSPSGEYALIEHGSTAPDGWVVVAQTANPEYLDYLQSLEE
jgi:uncharacterized protein YbdZ (MbtH family)